MFFSASVEARLVARQCSVQVAPAVAAPSLPAGLHIACLDDSKVARISLHTVLSAHVPGSIVTVFGATAAEVETFKETVRPLPASKVSPEGWRLGQRAPASVGIVIALVSGIGFGIGIVSGIGIGISSVGGIWCLCWQWSWYWHGHQCW